MEFKCNRKKYLYETAHILSTCTKNNYFIDICHVHKIFNTFSSSRVNPLPALILVLYLKVGHLTMGLRDPATGLGAIRLALLTLLSCRLFFLAGWLNQFLTYRCQSLWKCPFGIMLFLLGAMPNGMNIKVPLDSGSNKYYSDIWMYHHSSRKLTPWQ